MKRIALFLALAALVLLVSVASAQSGNAASAPVDGGYDLSWWTVNGGGSTFNEDDG